MPFTLTPIADTGRRFADFAPYVPSIDGRGRVAFQASLSGGGSAILLGEDGAILELARAGDPIRDFISHPDIADDGSFCAYAELRSGGQALVLGRAGSVTIAADTRAAFTRIGPLGPTMSETGAVAFRADTASATGRAGIFRVQGGSISAISGPGRFTDIHGLPIIDGRGRVVFRADLASGVAGIYRGDGGELVTVADTTSDLATLSRFPCVDDEGVVAFAATRRDGSAGVFTVSGGEVKAAVNGVEAFESVRGALLSGAGSVVLLATPRGGTLGAYDGTGGRILGVGDASFGSTVVEFALNPVSINRAGQLAIRVKLANGGQIIVRADPVGL